jgi:hypothetical protein
MGIFDKFAFWKKKEDDFDIDSLASKEMGLPHDELGLDQQPPGLDEKSPFDEPIPKEASPYRQQQQYQQPAAPANKYQAPNDELKDIELLSSKLDTIKALLNSLDQRLANVERSMVTEQKQKQRLW